MNLQRGIALSLVVLSTSVAASAAEIVGRWAGQATNGDASSPIALEFVEAKGALTGTVSFPRSGSLDNPIETVRLQENELRFTYKSRGVVRAFDGKVDEDHIAGVFTINGEKLNTTFEREADERPYTEEDVVYFNDDVKIAATLFVPNGEGQHPALVMLHGSGNNERYRYRFLADFYARLASKALSY